MVTKGQGYGEGLTSMEHHEGLFGVMKLSCVWYQWIHYYMHLSKPHRTELYILQ